MPTVMGYIKLKAITNGNNQLLSLLNSALDYTS